MSEYREYDGDTEHDMWVDYTYHEYTGELDDWFGDDDDEGGVDGCVGGDGVDGSCARNSEYCPSRFVQDFGSDYQPSNSTS